MEGPKVASSGWHRSWRLAARVQSRRKGGASKGSHFESKFEAVKGATSHVLSAVPVERVDQLRYNNLILETRDMHRGTRKLQYHW